jgi:hypothetical protein
MDKAILESNDPAVIKARIDAIDVELRRLVELQSERLNFAVRLSLLLKRFAQEHPEPPTPRVELSAEEARSQPRFIDGAWVSRSEYELF